MLSTTAAGSGQAGEQKVLLIRSGMNNAHDAATQTPDQQAARVGDPEFPLVRGDSGHRVRGDLFGGKAAHAGFPAHLRVSRPP
jgi:hypothetical protein